jgi:signal transduction histidine kinase
VRVPTIPKGFEIRVPPQAMCMVLGDPTDIYRILFNLVQNAVAVVRNGARMTFVAIDIAYQAPMVSVRIADDGPGLPKAIKSRLFRQTASTTGGSGLGIAIARELAERNGATLLLTDGPGGTSYVLALAGLRAVAGAPMWTTSRA